MMGMMEMMCVIGDGDGGTDGEDEDDGDHAMIIMASSAKILYPEHRILRRELAPSLPPGWHCVGQGSGSLAWNLELAMSA